MFVSLLGQTSPLARSHHQQILQQVDPNSVFHCVFPWEHVCQLQAMGQFGHMQLLCVGGKVKHSVQALAVALADSR